MAQTAAKLVDYVLPERVALRQFVLTVPFELRARLAYDAELLGGVSRELALAVQDFYRRRFESLGTPGGQTGAVTVVQRTSSDLRLNPHYHLLVLDGVFVAAEGAEEPVFHQLPQLSSLDVAEVLQVARVRILRFLERRGAIAAALPVEQLELLAESGGQEVSLGAIAAAATSGQVPAGPELRHRHPIALRQRGEVRVTGALVA